MRWECPHRLLFSRTILNANAFSTGHVHNGRAVFFTTCTRAPQSDEPEKTPSLLVSNEELTTRRDDCSPLVQRILDDADTAASTQLKEQGIKASLLAEAAVNSIDNFFTVVSFKYRGAVGDANGSFLDIAASQKVVGCLLPCVRSPKRAQQNPASYLRHCMLACSPSVVRGLL